MDSEDKNGIVHDSIKSILCDIINHNSEADCIGWDFTNIQDRVLCRLYDLQYREVIDLTIEKAYVVKEVVEQ